MIDPGVVESIVAVASIVVGYVGWVARRLNGWIDSQERRTRKNEVRSYVNRREIDSLTDRDATGLPPADDPANDRLGEIETDGGEPDGSR